MNYFIFSFNIFLDAFAVVIFLFFGDYILYHWFKIGFSFVLLKLSRSLFISLSPTFYLILSLNLL